MDAIEQSPRLYEARERFRKVRDLGTGGFCEVVECFDQNLHRSVARKELQNPTHAPHLRQLLNEARLISYLDHPGIVPIYDATRDEDGHFHYTMKVLDGRELSKRMTDLFYSRERMPLSEVLQIFTKLCETMAYTHDKGVLHLDLKPANVIIGSYGEVFLIDWGAARLYDRSRYEEYLRSKGQHDKTDELQDPIQNAVGTVPFLPPEQLAGPREALAPSADIFSAGVLLYHMLTCGFPYGTFDTPARSYLMEVKRGKPISVQLRRGDIPPRLAQICMKMVESQASQRQSSFHDILEELRDLSEAGRSFGTRFFEPGEVIFREGEEGSIAYQILEGKVEISTISKGQRRVLASRGTGDIIGELAVLTGGIRNATVTATEQTQVRVLTEALIEEELEKLNPWISQMIRNLSHKFIEVHRKRLAAPPTKAPT